MTNDEIQKILEEYNKAVCKEYARTWLRLMDGKDIPSAFIEEYVESGEFCTLEQSPIIGEMTYIGACIAIADWYDRLIKLHEKAIDDLRISKCTLFGCELNEEMCGRKEELEESKNDEE